jgi:uncharacterized glyoxalase superfamily protein PhnB
MKLTSYINFNGQCEEALNFYIKGDKALLGATNLESIGLVLNPFTRTLHPMRLLMAGLKNDNK